MSLERENSQHNYQLDVPHCNVNAITCSFRVFSRRTLLGEEIERVVCFSNSVCKHHNFLSIYCSHLVCSPSFRFRVHIQQMNLQWICTEKHASNKQNYIKIIVSSIHIQRFQSCSRFGISIENCNNLIDVFMHSLQGVFFFALTLSFGCTKSKTEWKKNHFNLCSRHRTNQGVRCARAQRS